MSPVDDARPATVEPDVPATQPLPGEVDVFTLSDIPAHLRWICAAGFFVGIVLTYLPWIGVVPHSLFVTGSQAPGFKDVVLIVGCPESMNEVVPSGEVKIDAVRTAASRLVANLPDGVRLALVVFGNNRDDVCGVQIAQKLAPLDNETRQAATKAIAELRPQGLAPLASAFERCEEILMDTNKETAIVLFTDGVDTCEGNPDAVASALLEKHEFTYGLHIVGFGAVPSEIRPLRATARAGGGTYHDAENAADLEQIVVKLVDDARRSQVLETTSQALATSQTGITAAFGVGPISASLLLTLYVLLLYVGLLACILLLVEQMVRPKVFTTISFLARTLPWLPLTILSASAACLLLLLLACLFGFPIERFDGQAVVFRRSWLYLAMLLSALTTATSYALFTLHRRKANKPALSLRLHW